MLAAVMQLSLSSGGFLSCGGNAWVEIDGSVVVCHPEEFVDALAAAASSAYVRSCFPANFVMHMFPLHPFPPSMRHFRITLLAVSAHFCIIPLFSVSRLHCCNLAVVAADSAHGC